eukprot:7638927-Alexandrium_andersonii.AAC.1
MKGVQDAFGRPDKHQQAEKDGLEAEHEDLEGAAISGMTEGMPKAKGDEYEPPTDPGEFGRGDCAYVMGVYGYLKAEECINILLLMDAQL